jgi:hypothetical protein
VTFVAGSREPMLDLSEASARTGLPAKTIRRAIAGGHLAGRMPRGQRKLYVLVEDLDDWATAEPVPQTSMRRAAPRRSAGKVEPLRPRDREPGSLARLEEIERRAAR